MPTGFKCLTGSLSSPLSSLRTEARAKNDITTACRAPLLTCHMQRSIGLCVYFQLYEHRRTEIQRRYRGRYNSWRKRNALLWTLEKLFVSFFKFSFSFFLHLVEGFSSRSINGCGLCCCHIELVHLRDKIAQSKIKETSEGWQKQIQRDVKQQKRLTSWHKVTHTSQSLFITAMLSKDLSSKHGSSGVLPAGCSSAFDCRVPDVLQVCRYVFMLKRNKKDPQTEKHRTTHSFKLCL